MICHYDQSDGADHEMFIGGEPDDDEEDDLQSGDDVQQLVQGQEEDIDDPMMGLSSASYPSTPKVFLFKKGYLINLFRFPLLFRRPVATRVAWNVNHWAVAAAIMAERAEKR